MALSKEAKPWCAGFFDFKPSTPMDQIIKYTSFSMKDPVSIDVINGKIGGPDTDYQCCLWDQSIDCYKVVRQDLLETLNFTRMKVAFFDQLETELFNMTVGVLHQKKERGVREHLFLYLAVQVTVLADLNHPKVGYCRYFNFCVRKPRKVDKLEDQIALITDDIFQTVRRCRQYIHTDLYDRGARVLNLKYPGYSWKYSTGEPTEPPKDWLQSDDVDTNQLSQKDENLDSQERRAFVEQYMDSDVELPDELGDVNRDATPPGSPPITISTDDELEATLMQFEEEVTKMEADSTN